MSTVILKDLVTIQGSYIAAVDIAETYAKASKSAEGMAGMEEKVTSYLVNDSSIETILNVAEGLSPASNERTHLIGGAYGTGKSHLGLVLANYFALPSDHPCLEPVVSQIAEQDADRAAEIRSLRASKRGFLVVIISGVEADTFNQALLQGLRSALRREELLHLIPTTAFDLARARMDGWRSSKPDLYDRFVVALGDLGQTSEGVVKGLEDYDDEAYKAFCHAHHEACDAAFEPFREEIDAKHFYADVSEEITKETDRFRGIAVIWDEYGEYLKSIARGGGDRLQSQFFAQFCNAREVYQCHFIVIAHLGLRDYFTTGLEYEDYVKQSGRFKESGLTTSNAEELIARALAQLRSDNPEGWEGLDRTGNWEELIQVMADLDLYPTATPEQTGWVEETVLKGCFPLHPLTVYCLPRLSEEVAQRHRTTFEFLKDLSTYLDEPAYATPGRLNLYPVDRLLDYFGGQIEAHRTHRRAFRAVTAGLSEAQNEQQERILKTIGIFDVLKDKKLKATADKLFAALYLPKVQRSTFHNDLEALVTAEVLRKRAHTGEYRLRGGEDYDYTEDFKREREETLRRLTNPVQTLNRQHPPDDVLAGGLKAEDYNTQFSMDRKLQAEFIGTDALEGTSEFQVTKNIEGPPYHDGICLYVIASNQNEVRQGRSKAETIEHPQIAIAIPQSPTPILDAMIDLETAKNLRQQEPYGKWGTDAYFEALERQQAYEATLNEVRGALLMPDNLTWYVAGEVEAVSGRWGAQDLASRMMFATFRDTPKITQERVAYKWKRTQKRQMVEVLDDLMDFHTPIKLRASGAGKPSSKELLLAESLRATGLLEFERDAGMNDDYEVRWPAEGASAYKAWIRLDEIVKHEIPKDKLTKAVTALAKPPFGMSDRARAILLAAYIRHNRRDLTFLSNGTVIPTLTGEAMYDMVGNPSAYTVVYRKLDPRETRYLKTVCRLTGQAREVIDQPTIHETSQCLKSWFTQLPSAAKSGQDVSAESKLVLTVLTDDTPIEDETLLFRSIPEAVGASQLEVREWDSVAFDDFEKAFAGVMAELQGFSETFAQRILRELRRIFDATGSTDPDLADAVRQWFNGLSGDCQIYPHTGDAQVLKEQAQSDAPVRERFLVKLPEGLGLDRFTDWSDPNGTLTRYVGKVTETKRFLEEFRVGPAAPPRDWKKLLRERLAAMIDEFSYKASRTEIIEELRNVLEELSSD